MVKKDDDITMKLVDQDGFEEQSLSDASDDNEKQEIQSFRINRHMQNTMGSFMQVVLYMMFMALVMGISMLAFHIVARTDSNRTIILIVGVAASWIAATNIFALAAFIIDKYQAFNGQPRMTEALALTHFLIGGVVGGWLAACFTCYKPPAIQRKLSGFICRCMICSLLGITIIIFLILRVILPNIEAVKIFTP